MTFSDQYLYVLVWTERAELLDLVRVGHRVEIPLLRQQLHILQRKHPRTPHISRWEKLLLLKWHRQLVRRKVTQ
jgi:hypothetical protein